MFESKLNQDAFIHSMNFHGQQVVALLKELQQQKFNVDWTKINFDLFRMRTKELRLEDRGKRLLLHKFIAQNAIGLFQNTNNEPVEVPDDNNLHSIFPPFEIFSNIPKNIRIKKFFDVLNEGDVLICRIIQKSLAGLLMIVMCFDISSKKSRFIDDLNVRCFCPAAELELIEGNNVNSLKIDDFAKVVVLEVRKDSQKLLVGTRNIDIYGKKITLGRISSKDFPSFYTYLQPVKDHDLTFKNIISKSSEFLNPDNSSLMMEVGLTDKPTSCLHFLSKIFPEKKCCKMLRSFQGNSWALNHVAEGIKNFKEGNNIEAFQCFNQALKIDENNVEGLVARGALFANNGSLEKAVDDFEKALNHDPNHKNAKKYLSETLIVIARNYEETKDTDLAITSYEKILKFVPDHEEANNSFCFLTGKPLPKCNVENSNNADENSDAVDKILSTIDVTKILGNLKNTSTTNNKVVDKTEESHDLSDENNKTELNLLEEKPDFQENNSSSLTILNKLNDNINPEGYVINNLQPPGTEGIEPYESLSDKLKSEKLVEDSNFKEDEDYLNRVNNFLKNTRYSMMSEEEKEYEDKVTSFLKETNIPLNRKISSTDILAKGGMKNNKKHNDRRKRSNSRERDNNIANYYLKDKSDLQNDNSHKIKHLSQDLTQLDYKITKFMEDTKKIRKFEKVSDRKNYRKEKIYDRDDKRSKPNEMKFYDDRSMSKPRIKDRVTEKSSKFVKGNYSSRSDEYISHHLKHSELFDLQQKYADKEFTHDKVHTIEKQNESNLNYFVKYNKLTGMFERVEKSVNTEEENSNVDNLNSSYFRDFETNMSHNISKKSNSQKEFRKSTGSNYISHNTLEPELMSIIDETEKIKEARKLVEKEKEKLKWMVSGHNSFLDINEDILKVKDKDILVSYDKKLYSSKDGDESLPEYDSPGNNSPGASKPMNLPSYEKKQGNQNLKKSSHNKFDRKRGISSSLNSKEFDDIEAMISKAKKQKKEELREKHKKFFKSV